METLLLTVLQALAVTLALMLTVLQALAVTLAHRQVSRRLQRFVR
jgi:hypothetical protein